MSRQKIEKVSRLTKRLAILLILTFLNTLSFAEESLQAILDKAAESGSKQVNLSGNYFLDKPLVLTNKHSGLKIEGGGKTLISGAKKASELGRDGKFWTAKVDADRVESIFVNGRRAIPAESDCRFAHSPLNCDTNERGEKINPELDGFNVRKEDAKELLNISKDELKNAELDLYLVWYNVHAKLLGFRENGDKKTLSLFLENPTKRALYQWEKFPRFKIRNLKSLLDTPGEFVFDKASKKITYFPREGEDIASSSILYPALSEILLIKGESDLNKAKNISLSGLTFECGGHFPDKKWQQAPQAQASVSGFVRVENADCIEIKNCEVRNCNSYGIEFASGVTNSKVKNSILYDCGSGGIRVGALSGSSTYQNEISNNIIYCYGRYNKAAVGICIFSSGSNLIDHNAIFDGYYTAISVGWTWGFAPTHTQNNRITNNRIFKIGHGVMDDMGGIYTLGDATGSVIMYNEISDVWRHRYGGWGIYNDEGSRGFFVSKNYVHDTHEDGYFQHYGMHNLIKNNIFKNAQVSQIGLGRKDYKDSYRFTNNIVVFSRPAQLFRSNDKIAPDIASFDRNIYWCENEPQAPIFSGLTLAQWQATGQDKNSFVENPNLSGTDFLGDSYKKIDFQPFSTKDSGVSGKMREKFDKILKNYEFPPRLRMPPEPNWERDFYEDFKSAKPGKTPPNIGARTEKKNVDIIVIKEGKEKFLRLIDGKNSRDFFPYLEIPASLKGSEILVKFRMRLSDESNFFVEGRDNLYRAGFPSIRILNSKLQTPKGLLELPKAKWLDVEFTFALHGGKKALSCIVRDGGKALANFKSNYEAENFDKLSCVVISAIGEKGHFDLDDIEIKNAN